MARKVSIRDILSANIVRFRTELGLTQEELAEKADVSVRYLQQLEGGVSWPSDKIIMKLAKALKIEPSLLFAVKKS